MTRAWRAGAFAISIAGALAACRTLYWTRPEPKFPEAAAPAIIPLRDALWSGDLTVEAAFAGADGGAATASIWLAVDSGCTACMVPREFLARIGLEPLPQVTSSGRDAFGHTIEGEVALAHAVTLGPMTVNDVVVDVSKDVAVLGETVLAHAPWEIDLDRSVLILNAPPWPDSPEITTLPLTHIAAGNADLVSVSIDDKPMDMLLDTGAVRSAIPEDIGERAGLAVAEWTGGPMRGAGGRGEVRRSFHGNVVLGGLALGARVFAMLPQGEAWGILGRDLLSRYRVHVTPGKRVALRPRRDLRAMTRERIARWSWVPECSHAGCVRAQIEPADAGAAALTLTFDASMPLPLQIVFACAGDDSAELRTSSELLGAGRIPGPMRHVVARVLNASNVEPAVIIMPLGDRLWFAKSGAGCHELEALDVAPLPPSSAPPGTRAWATFWP